MHIKMKLLIDSVVTNTMKNLKKEICDNILLVEFWYLYNEKIYDVEASKVQISLDKFATTIDAILNNFEESIKQSMKDCIKQSMKEIDEGIY